MRRLASAVLAISLAFSIGAVPAEAKSFKNCTELRKTYSYGVALSRISKNKGERVIYSPKVSPSVYRANKAKDADKDGIVCEVAKKAAVTKPAPTAMPAITMDSLDAKYTSLVAQREIALGIKSSEVFDAKKLIIQLGPSLTSSDVTKPTQAVSNTAALFGGFFAPDTVRINWFTYKDTAWVDQAMNASGGMATATPDGQSYSSWISAVGQNGCNMGNAMLGSLGPVFNQCLMGGAPPSHSSETAAHEYFHLVQYSAAGSGLPILFMEGGATFVGVHVGGYSFGDFALTRQNNVSRNAQRDLDLPLRNAVANNDVASVVERLGKTIQSSPSEQAVRQSSYVLGLLVFEAMVATKGLEVWKQFVSDTKSLGFAGSLAKQYDLTAEQLFHKVAPYVISQLKVQP